MIDTKRQHGTLCVWFTVQKKDSVLGVSHKYVYMESRSADVDTVEVQGRLMLDRERAFVEQRKGKKVAENAQPLNLQWAGYTSACSMCTLVSIVGQMICIQQFLVILPCTQILSIHVHAVPCTILSRWGLEMNISKVTRGNCSHSSAQLTFALSQLQGCTIRNFHTTTTISVREEINTIWQLTDGQHAFWCTPIENYCEGYFRSPNDGYISNGFVCSQQPALGFKCY